MKKQFYLFLLCLLAPLGVFAGPTPPTYIEGAVTVMASEVMTMRSTLTDLALIDTRRPQDYAKGFIPGAVNISPPRLSQERMEELVPQSTTPVIFYCQDSTCIRAAEAVKQALSYGYSKVHYYYGGYSDWVAQDYPVNLP